MRSIGIIGQGFVGTAVREGMRHALDVFTCDKKLGDRILEWRRDYLEGLPHYLGEFGIALEKILDYVDGPIFLCLPTPMLPDGRCDVSIVESVVGELDVFAYMKGRAVVVAIKSTIPPGTTDTLNDKYDNVSVCFQPEFLTEANADRDFREQTRVVCGGPAEAVEVVREAYASAFPGVEFIAMSSTEAELVKYFTNCGLACRVSLANEFKQIADALHVDYQRIIDVAKETASGKADTRMGLTHWDVPGPDLHKGFGGSCFVKDLNALIYVAQRLGVEPTCLAAAWQKNLEVRPERDWEQLKGRAVVDVEPADLPDEADVMEKYTAGISSAGGGMTQTPLGCGLL